MQIGLMDLQTGYEREVDAAQKKAHAKQEAIYTAYTKKRSALEAVYQKAMKTDQKAIQTAQQKIQTYRMKAAMLEEKYKKLLQETVSANKKVFNKRSPS